LSIPGSEIYKTIINWTYFKKHQDSSFAPGTELNDHEFHQLLQIIALIIFQKGTNQTIKQSELTAELSESRKQEMYLLPFLKGIKKIDTEIDRVQVLFYFKGKDNVIEFAVKMIEPLVLFLTSMQNHHYLPKHSLHDNPIMTECNVVSGLLYIILALTQLHRNEEGVNRYLKLFNEEIGINLFRIIGLFNSIERFGFFSKGFIFQYLYLSGANLGGVDPHRVNLSGANLQGAITDGAIGLDKKE
jgi:hypothetical protein